MPGLRRKIVQRWLSLLHEVLKFVGTINSANAGRHTRFFCMFPFCARRCSLEEREGSMQVQNNANGMAWRRTSVSYILRAWSRSSQRPVHLCHGLFAWAAGTLTAVLHLHSSIRGRICSVLSFAPYKISYRENIA